MRIEASLWLSGEDRCRLEAIAKNRNSRQKHVWRARIVLLSADGVGTMEIVRQTGKSKPCVWRWQERYIAQGVEGLLRDAGRPPGKAPLSPEVVRKVVDLTHEPPPLEETHWSARAMAAASGVSISSVQRIWKAHGLYPHRVKTFKLSNDPAFADKLYDVVGLYMNPPERAVVLSVDEKSQIQALDRTQLGLPLKKGRCNTMTHDYKRNGTTTLFAALNVLDGSVIGQCMKRHRWQEFLSFLKTIDRTIPAHLDIHIIVDNYATHKKQEVRDWLEKHPRFHFHFTATSASWMNAVEGFFSKLTKQRLKRGVFKSVSELENAIMRFIEEKNENPKPFIWTADPSGIIEKINRGKQALESIH